MIRTAPRSSSRSVRYRADTFAKWSLNRVVRSHSPKSSVPGEISAVTPGVYLNVATGPPGAAAAAQDVSPRIVIDQQRCTADERAAAGVARGDLLDGNATCSNGSDLPANPATGVSGSAGTSGQRGMRQEPCRRPHRPSPRRTHGTHPPSPRSSPAPEPPSGSHHLPPARGWTARPPPALRSQAGQERLVELQKGGEGPPVLVMRAGRTTAWCQPARRPLPGVHAGPTTRRLEPSGRSGPILDYEGTPSTRTALSIWPMRERRSRLRRSEPRRR